MIPISQKVCVFGNYIQQIEGYLTLKKLIENSSAKWSQLKEIFNLLYLKILISQQVSIFGKYIQQIEGYLEAKKIGANEGQPYIITNALIKQL